MSFIEAKKDPSADGRIREMDTYITLYSAVRMEWRHFQENGWNECDSLNEDCPPQVRVFEYFESVMLLER